MIVETPKGRIYRKFFNANTGKVGDSLLGVYAGELFSIKSLTWYLSIGYVPGDMTLFENIFCLPGGAKCEVEVGGYKVLDRFYYEDLINKEKYKDCSKEELLKEAHETLLKVVEREFRKDPNMALALTGGLDSRLLLGALLEVTEAKNIKAFSWGFKDSYDYEIGILIAKKVGVNHISYNLDQISFGIKDLKEFFAFSDGNTNLFEQPPVLAMQKDLKDLTLWYGMLGGTTSGANSPNSILEKPESYYLINERKRTGNLSDVAYSILESTISISDVKELTREYKTVSFDTIDIYNHHERLICNTVFHNNFKYSVPFASDEWLSFTLSIPIKYRNRRRSLLNDHISNFYPKLARIPSANTKGMPLTSLRSERIIHRIGELFESKKKNPRRKFFELASLINTKEWMGLKDAYLLSNKLEGIDLPKISSDLMAENKIMNHWKTLELLFSISFISDMILQKK